MSGPNVRVCSTQRVLWTIAVSIFGSLVYIIWFGMNSDHDNVHPLITQIIPAGHCTCHSAASFHCSECLACVNSTAASNQPSEWKFQYGRDDRNLGLNQNQCQTSFPGLFQDILRSGTYWKARGGVSAEDLDDTPLENGMAKAMIYNGELYIIATRAQGGDNRRKIVATLSSISRALSASPDRTTIPNIEFILSVEDRIDDVNGVGHPIWTFSRKISEESAWLMPDFGFWAWGHWSNNIGPFGQAIDRVKTTETGLAFSDKERKLVWRGKLSFAPKLRRTLLDAARNKPWGDVKELVWNRKTNFLTMEDHCRYMFIAHVEGTYVFRSTLILHLPAVCLLNMGANMNIPGRSYSGSLKYRQACRSVVVAHQLQYIQHYHYLLVSSGPHQNYVEVNRNFSDLSETMDSLLNDPDTAERIANNSVSTFRERYLTLAADACYWRALWNGWAAVSANVTSALESRIDESGFEAGLRYESFMLLDSRDMLQFSFKDYEI